MDIAEWLRGLGLEQYEGAFRANAIDAEVLRDLTAEGLRELGVSLIGHRRKLLTAIADLRREGPLPIAETTPGDPFPQSAMPQPNFVPVMPSTSRNTQSRGVSPSTSTVRSAPLTLI
jgi:hypothetical protein